MATRAKGPYSGRSPQKQDDDVASFGAARATKMGKKAEAAEMTLAEKMPPGTSPTPPPRHKVTATEVSTGLSTPPREADKPADIPARLQSLELEMSNLTLNLTERIQETVGTAILAALAKDREQTPQWASQFQTSLTALEASLSQVHATNLQTAQAVAVCEGQIQHLQAQVENCVNNVHPIYLSERAAMISTAAQTRISGFKEGQDGTKFIQEYVKSKLPNLGKISVTKNGPGTYVTSFASAEDAKKAAKAFRSDHHQLSVRPQLPPVVLESQGPLKRAFASLAEWAKTENSPSFPNLKNFRIDFKARAITDGEQWLARQLADGSISTNFPLLGQECGNRMILASQGQPREGKGPSKGKGKGKGKGIPQKSSKMDIDK